MRLATFAWSGRCLSSVAMVIAVSASPAGAKDLVLTRQAISGVASPIAHERAWDKACAARFAVVSITRQPDHGTLVVEHDVSAIPPTTPRFGDTGACAGRSVAGNQFVYRSQPGFHGDDHISWDVAYDGRPKAHTDVTIKVR